MHAEQTTWNPWRRLERPTGAARLKGKAGGTIGKNAHHETPVATWVFRDKLHLVSDKIDIGKLDTRGVVQHEGRVANR